jgi:carboxypeptidase family protein/TonB-dependent receptor-like protein
MFSHRHLGVPLRAAALAIAFVLASTSAAFAQATATLSGTVTSSGQPLTAAGVTVSGSNLILRGKTDAQGSFRFTSVPIGTYNVDVSAPEGSASLRVDLVSAGANVTISVSKIKEIGRTSVTARPSVRGSGTDLSLNAEALTRSPAGGSLPNLLIQLPGAARGANGVVHINGDHGDINYIVDGVQIPQELNRIVGSEFDPNDIGFIEALQGAYPAQYGERFASVININTRNGSGAPGLIGDFNYGSYGHLDTTIGYHTKVGAGTVVAAFRNERGTRGLDPPNFDSPHNSFSNANQFLRFTLPAGPNYFNLTVSRSYQTYQIPNDVANGQPPATDNVETQDDLFTALQFRHPIGDHGSLSFGPSYKRSRIRDFGDPNNDFTFGQAISPAAPGDCANALTSTGPVVNGVVTNPVGSGNYANGTCAFSLNGDRIAIDVGGNLDYENRSPKHDVSFGGIYNATHVAKTYAVTLQPGNFLAPIFTPATPGAPYTVVDSSPNIGHLGAFYVQDSWKMGTAWQLDYGVRADTFKVTSTEFSTGFGQLSPRLKLTRFFGARDSVYAYYGRFFTPFSLENVAPLAAYTLNLPLQANVAQFDLKPQRDSVYEIGGHFALGRGDLGVRVMQKNATDLIDDTQVGVTNLHQDINFAQGRISTQTAYYQLPLARAGRFYAAVTHTYSVNKGCETQLLAPCFGVGNDWTPADHDQRVDVTSGLIVNDRRGGWLGIDGEYGSGLSSALNPGAITCGGADGNAGGPCKRTPHLTFDAEKGFALHGGMALTVRVRNIFNDRYFVTFANAQGQHYAPPRTFDVGLRFNTK